MGSKRKIVFLTGTRADFGKLKSLIKISRQSGRYEVHIFATGMHMSSRYGKTVLEIEKSGFDNIFPYINHDDIEHMDRNLARTIEGFSHYISELKPDLIVVHGDRVEALAGAIVGSLNNILVAHIEGGEISGTIDELIRHSVTKMAHVHLVANEEAARRIHQMGEELDSIHVIGSPDIDVMASSDLPPLEKVLEYYEIPFEDFGILMFHPVTTEVDRIRDQARILVDAILESGHNFVVIYPNNDLGSNYILDEYRRFAGLGRVRLFPSIRFEFFLVLLKNARFMIGNSSAGVREAPYYNVPTINIGNRQNNRVSSASVLNVDFKKDSILERIQEAVLMDVIGRDVDFGSGESDRLFLELLDSGTLWSVDKQKQFRDVK